MFLHRAIKFPSRRAYDNAQRSLTRAGRIYNLEKVICFSLIDGVVIFVFGKGKLSSLELMTVYGCIADSACCVGCRTSKFLWWKNCNLISFLFFSFPMLVVICLADGCYFISCILYVILSNFVVICKPYKERKVWCSTSNWIFLQALIIFFKGFWAVQNLWDALPVSVQMIHATLH